MARVQSEKTLVKPMRVAENISGIRNGFHSKFLKPDLF